MKFTKQNQMIKIIPVMALLALSIGCAKQKKPDDSTMSSMDNSSSSDSNSLGDSDSGKAMGLETVHFPYDSFEITSNEKTTAKNNANILKDKGSLRIQIEGHCDQRGGIQYNIALGEKRANVVKKFLISEGIAAERITTISYGKERPINSSENEEAYSKNRRANFVITSK
jgi:peptidoglycan-associated lipoprotein